MYAIWNTSALLGTTEFESGDPSMGVAEGRFHPADGYRRVRSLFMEHSRLSNELRGAAASSPKFTALCEQIILLGLRAVTEDGEQIESAGVIVTDYSDDLGPEGIEVSVLGAPWPKFAVWFPHLVSQTY